MNVITLSNQYYTYANKQLRHSGIKKSTLHTMMTTSPYNYVYNASQLYCVTVPNKPLIPACS